MILTHDQANTYIEVETLKVDKGTLQAQRISTALRDNLSVCMCV